MSDLPYEAEVRLLRWGDSSTVGRTITLELDPNAGDANPFKGFPVGKTHGARFRMRFDLIRDDETIAGEPPKEETVSLERPAQGKPVDPDKSARAKEAYAALPPMKQDVVRCAQLCNDARFGAWIARHLGDALSDHFVTPDYAAGLVRGLLSIESRSEIGYDAAVNKQWRELETQYLKDTGQMAEPRG